MSSDVSDQLKPLSTGIAQYLSNNYFVIPTNQREYRWSDDQLNQLWSDMLSVVNQDMSTQSYKGHFFGAIVVIGDDKSSPDSRLSVIDGQQRLTTFSIFASCLLGVIDCLEDKKIRKIKTAALENCLVSYVANAAPRIYLNSCNEFFKSLILSESKDERNELYTEHYNPKSEVQSNIKNSFEFFDLKITEYLSSYTSKEEKSDAVRDLVDSFIDGLYFLVVRTTDNWMAYRLFETLNARGLDLSQSDLIKNTLLEISKEDHQEDYVAERWSSFIDNYESQHNKKLELPQLVQFSYSYRNNPVKKDEIFDQVSYALARGKSTATELVNNFVHDSQCWNNFLLGDIEGWEESNLDITKYFILKFLWKDHCTPFIMAAVDRFSKDIASLKLCLEACEKYLFRQGMVVRDSVANLQQLFTLAAKQLRSDVELERVIELFQQRSPDSIFIESLKDYKVSSLKQAFYILYKIESSKNNSLIDPYVTPAQHIDYMLPKKVDDSLPIMSDESYVSYVSKIGNIFLLESHLKQKVKRSNLDDKISIYNESSFLTSCESYDTKLTNFELIEDRQKYLVQSANNIWSL